MGRQLDELCFFSGDPPLMSHHCVIVLCYWRIDDDDGPSSSLQCGLGRGLPPFCSERRLHPSSYLATTDMGQNWVGVPFFLGIAGSTSNTMLRRPRSTCVGRGLPPYQVASSSTQPFGHNRRGPKIGWGFAPFEVGGLVPI